MIRAWLTLASEIILKTPIFNLQRVRRQHPDPDDGRQGDFVVIDSPDWVNIIALLPSDPNDSDDSDDSNDEDILIVRQYRHGTDTISTEVPAGLIDPGESPLQAAQRELLEETGYTANTWTCLGKIRPNPAFLTNTCTTFLATDLRRTHAQDLDANEEISLERWPLQRWLDAVADGTIDHAIVVCAAFHYLHHTR